MQSVSRKLHHIWIHHPRSSNPHPAHPETRITHNASPKGATPTYHPNPKLNRQKQTSRGNARLLRNLPESRNIPKPLLRCVAVMCVATLTTSSMPVRPSSGKLHRFFCVLSRGQEGEKRTEERGPRDLYRHRLIPVFGTDNLCIRFPIHSPSKLILGVS